MIEINNPKIDIDRIKACIAEEAARYEACKDTEDALLNQPGDPFCEDSALPGRQDARDPVDKDRLLRLHGEEFIDEAYKAILRRDPDARGRKVYLEKLMAGRLTRLNILGRLRYSREGRLKKVTVKGLLPAFLAHSFFTLPVLGWAARMITGVLNFPGLLRYIQRMENEAFVRHRHLEHQIGSVQSHTSALEHQLGSVQSHTSALEHQLYSVQSHVSDLQNDLSDIKSENQKLHQALTDRVEENNLLLLDFQRTVNALLEETRFRAGDPETQKSVSLADREQDHLLDGLYVSFENRFRGSSKEIKARLSVYLPRVIQSVEHTTCRQVLDLGCGRGEWLELLKENHIPATGLDLNRIMVGICTKAGLDVAAADALVYLRGLAPESIGVITGFHIVEHLPFHTLTALLDESRRVLVPGGMVIFETPNPENILVGACDFYTDPTHRNPIPPHTLSFLVSARGFIDPQVLRLHPAEGVAINDPFLHHLFTVGKDYAVIGYKK